MSSTRKLSITLFAAASSLSAASDSKALSNYGFGGPEVIKLDWATRSMNVRDFNADGLNDIAVVNNDQSKIEILYRIDETTAAVTADAKKQVSDNRWEPLLEDASYRREAVAVGFPVFDMVVGDLNSDGLTDLIYTAREVPVTVRYQSKDGQWNQSDEFDGFEPVGWTDSMVVADVDGNGHEDLLIIASDALRVFRQNTAGELQEPELFHVSGNNPYNMMLHDVTEDGLLDILYLSSSGKQSLALRAQLPDGGFGPERRFIFDRPVRRIVALPRSEEAEAQTFAAIDTRTGLLEFFQIKPAAQSVSTSSYTTIQPEVFPIFKKGRLPTRYVQADLNADSSDDLIVSNPSSSELVVFMGQPNGFESPQNFPTFSDISSMTSGHFFVGAGDSVVVLSEAEKALGASQLDARGRMSFPLSIILPDEAQPLVSGAADLDGDGLDELVLFVTEDSDGYLMVLEPEDRTEPSSDWEVRERIALRDMRRKPNAMKFIDVLGEERMAVMLFVPREAPLIFASRAGKPFSLEEHAKDSPVRQSLLKDILPAQIATIDIDSDGVKELVVGRAGYARALRFSGGQIEMVDQFNARRGDDLVSAVVPITQDGAVEQLMLYVESQGELQLLDRDADGVFRYAKTNTVGTIELIDWFGQNAAQSASDLLFVGEGRFWRLPARGQSWDYVPRGRFETELDDVHYSHLMASDFAGDGELDLIAVDGQNHVVEIVSGQQGQWQSRIYWEVFGQNMHYQGRTGGNLEPRQIVIADFNGSGRDDFAFLVHDRILVYPQQ